MEGPKSVRIIYAPMPRAEPGFDICAQLREFFRRVRTRPRTGDILAVSGKYISVSEGRLYPLGDVVPMEDVVRIAGEGGGDPRMGELVARESDLVLPGFYGIYLGEARGILQPNAGIDRSNAPEGHVVLYPEDPNRSAEKVRACVRLLFGADVGVVITDSRIYPSKKGTSGVCIGCSGVVPYTDERGSLDLFRRPLKVTRRSVSDQIASAAQLAMGESGEAVPIVLIRGLEVYYRHREVRADPSVSHEEDIYFSAIRNYLKALEGR